MLDIFYPHTKQENQEKVMIKAELKVEQDSLSEFDDVSEVSSSFAIESA